MTQLISLFLLATAPAVAAEPACPALASPQSVLDCALRAHPAAMGAAALLAQSEALGSAAGQRPNPEAEAAGVFGDSQDQIQVSLLHTFETGGKRGRRLNRARAEALALGAEALSIKEEIAVDTVSDLYRLRQIREELKLLQEALDTFARIARQLRARPRRSPEQEVSLSVFQLAERDYSVKRSALEGETLALRRTLELGLGAPLPESDAVLPARPGQWPDPGAPGSPAAFRGSTALRAAAALEAAQAELGSARAAAYPDVKLGPNILRQKNGPGEGSSTLLGAGLSLPLPLYQRNAGGKRLAARAVETAQARSAAAMATLGAQRDAELARYRAATSTLVQAGDTEKLEAEHEKMDGLYERGVISSALVIEAHRQMVDYTRNLNERELSAVRALWTIYAIEGRVLTEKL